MAKCTPSSKSQVDCLTNRIPDKSRANFAYLAATERLKAETKLFQNLAMCEAQLKSFNDEFVNNCLTGHTLMEWSDRVEKLNKAKAMILKLIESKVDELTRWEHDIA